MTTLWRNFSLNVVANSNWSCLLISAPKAKFIEECNRLPAARRSSKFNKMHGALHALHVSLNNASMELSANAWKRTLQIWVKWTYRFWGTTHEAILKPSSEAQNRFWIKNCTGEDIGQFSAGPVNKAVPSFTSSLTRLCEWWQKTF